MGRNFELEISFDDMSDVYRDAESKSLCKAVELLEGGRKSQSQAGDSCLKSQHSEIRGRRNVQQHARAGRDTKFKANCTDTVSSGLDFSTE